MPSSFTLQSILNAIPQIRLTSLNICKLSAHCQPVPIASSSCHMTAISASCGLAIPCHGVIFTRNCFTLSRVKRTRLSQSRGFLLKTALSSAFSENTVLSRGILLRLLCHRALQKCGVHLLPHVPNICPINRHVKSPGFAGRLPVLSYIWSPGGRRKSPGF